MTVLQDAAATVLTPLERDSIIRGVPTFGLRHPVAVLDRKNEPGRATIHEREELVQACSPADPDDGQRALLRLIGEPVQWPFIRVVVFDVHETYSLRIARLPQGGVA